MNDQNKHEDRGAGSGGTRDGRGLTIRASHFWLGVLALFVVFFGGIWLAIPGADSMHRLTSPSGNIWLDVGEICQEESCGQIIVLDFAAPNGERYRNPCPTNLREDHPVFVTVSADWAEDDTAVVLTYADAKGQGGTISLDLAVDCAVT